MCAGLVLYGGFFAWTFRGREGGARIIVIDDFASDHGRIVSNVAREWSLGACPVVELNAGSSGTGYLKALYAAAAQRGWKTDYSCYGRHIGLAVATRMHTEVEREDAPSPAGGYVERVTTKRRTGTSESAPKLAGLLGLVWSSHPRMSREQILALMTRNCRPMRDAYYLDGKLGRGELYELGMLWEGGLRWAFVLSAGFLTLILIVFVVESWERASGSFLCLVGLCPAWLLLAMADLAWAVRAGGFVTCLAFLLLVPLYTWFAPLRGRVISVLCEAGTEPLLRRLAASRFTRLGGAVRRTEEVLESVTLHLSLVDGAVVCTVQRNVPLIVEEVRFGLVTRVVAQFTGDRWERQAMDYLCRR